MRPGPPEGCCASGTRLAGLQRDWTAERETERDHGNLSTPRQQCGLVRLKDVARAELGSQDYSVTGRLNGKPSAIMAIYQLPGSNAVETAAGVQKLMAEAKTRFPDDM